MISINTYIHRTILCLNNIYCLFYLENLNRELITIIKIINKSFVLIISITQNQPNLSNLEKSNFKLIIRYFLISIILLIVYFHSFLSSKNYYKFLN